MNLKNKTVTVIGLGKSGFAAAKFLVEKGALVRVTEGSTKQDVLERAEYLRAMGVRVEVGGHTSAFLDGADQVVVSPGVPKTSPPLVQAAVSRIPVISEIELAYQFCPGKIIAVTGSNGKTTTCHLLYRMFRSAGRSVVLCGNVGFSFLDALTEIRRNTFVILELSSFQLEDSPSLRPHIAVVLNISPNHLDRHGTMARYIRAKENIFRSQRTTDAVLLNSQDPIVSRMRKKIVSRVYDFALGRPVGKGFYELDGNLYEKTKGKPRLLFSRESIALKGGHNIQNVLAAAGAARLFNLSVAAIRDAVESFHTLEHRIEPLGEIGGIHFVNDSKSTTVASTRAAIESIHGPIILIAGGRPKGASFSEVEALVSERVRHAVLYGEARAAIASSWKNFPRVSNEQEFGQAVERAFDEAKPGDTILLSPMCTSFDQFTSFEARGEAFKKAFERLSGKVRA